MEAAFFADLEDPEHLPGDVGRIEWTVTGVRGTWERRNKEMLMTSPPVRIGGLYWRIKFYPRGNQTDYTSVYLEASQSPREGDPSGEAQADNDGAVTEPARLAEEPAESDQRHTSQSGPAVPASEPLHQSNSAEPRPNEDTTSIAGTGDVPMLGSDPAVRVEAGSKLEENDDDDEDQDDLNWSTAAQFGIVMYNPSEPRVYCAQGMQHRFSRSSPDWGWTRFYGPYNEVHTRRRGQRQAMLRNDTLAFAAYIRLVKDETYTLWDDDPFGPSWDSLARTGLRALRPKRSEESFMVAAIASWAQLAPFRQIIYSVPTVNPLEERHATPKPLIIALQRIFHRLQAQQRPSSSPVSLKPLHDYFSAMGGDLCTVKDVVDFWEVLRQRLDGELRGTDMDGKLRQIFDGSLRREADKPDGGNFSSAVSHWPISAGKASKLRLPVRGVKNVQEAFAKVLNEHNSTGRAALEEPPQLLQVQLDRQLFDTDSRTWKKIVDKIGLDETVDLRPWTPDAQIEARYSLYGLIVHSGGLRSGRYHPVLRPGGPGTRWYAYLPRSETVVCRTRKQAIEDHQGVAQGQESDGSEAVAYVLLYIRDDVISTMLQGLSERSCAPQWIRRFPPLSPFLKPVRSGPVRHYQMLC